VCKAGPKSDRRKGTERERRITRVAEVAVADDAGDVEIHVAPLIIKHITRRIREVCKAGPKSDRRKRNERERRYRRVAEVTVADDAGDVEIHVAPLEMTNIIRELRQ